MITGVHRVAIIAAVVGVAVGWGRAALAEVTVEEKEDRYTVKIDGELFTEYIFKGYAKPILYPVIGPHGISMTRNWPLAEATEGESKDHPHQKSLWFAHGDVNGIDFWAEGPGRGKILERVAYAEAFDGGAMFNTFPQWQSPDGTKLVQEERFLIIRQIGTSRVIDIAIQLFAEGHDATFGDTKEGTMAIRTRPELEIRKGAKAVNSEGVTGRDVWGKRAKWVDYSAEVDGKVVGVAIFDHPGNPRHPTWWHARDYGLIAANPFGIHDFSAGEKGAGNLTIPAGQSVTFHYRFVFHEGDAQEAKIAELYEAYAAEKFE